VPVTIITAMTAPAARAGPRPRGKDAIMTPTHAPTPTREHPTSGIVSLVAGILGLTALPVLGSILAIIFGNRCQRDAEARPERYRDDLGRIGRVLGWVGLALAGLGLLLGVAFSLLFV
jgi:hypothetical protein